LNHLNLKLEGAEDLRVGKCNHKDHIEKQRCAKAPSALFPLDGERLRWG
jgi:hypothetical protein